MNDDFKKAVGNISKNLREITTSDYWEEDLEIALETIELTPKQIEIIKSLSTDTLFNDKNDSIMALSIEQRLVHAFKDPAVKMGMMFEHASLGAFSDEDTMRLLLETRNALEDIIHNYTMMLGENMPRSVSDILEEYSKNTLVQLNNQIFELSKETGINADDIELGNNGWEHISKLPENAFTNE